MADENSTEKHSNYTIKAIGIPNAFFDPAWQLALTVEFYFKYAVLAIGIFGTMANAMVLYALVIHNAREAKKRAINLLIINQNVLDLCCCFSLLVSVSVQINNPSLKGAFGYFLCVFFFTDTATYSALYGSVINLVGVTAERYLKVVYPFWSKKHLKRWMIQAAMAFAWIAGIASNFPLSFVMARVEDGLCFSSFESPDSYWILGSCNLAIFFFCPLIIFIYCYVRIVVVMRRQVRVMAGHNVEGSAQMNASQAQSKRIKWNIIKTMIIVSVAFTLCWLPNNIFFLVLTYSVQTSTLAVGYYPTVFLAYLNICMNPFIYALKHEGVKTQLARMFACLKPSHVGAAPGSSSHQAGGTQETRTGMRQR